MLSASATCAGAFYYLSTGLLYGNNDLNIEILLFDVIFSFVVLVYIAIVYNENKEGAGEEGKERELKDFKKDEDFDDVQLNSGRQVNYKNFQGLLICYSMFLGMVLTNWEGQEFEGFGKLVRCGQCAVLIVFYTWTLVAPHLFTDRSFT